MHIIQAVKKYTNKAGEDKTFNTQIGTAFVNKDGSFSLKFDYFPTEANAWIILRERDENFARRNKPEVNDANQDTF